MSLDLKNLPKPECFSHMSVNEYDRFAIRKFKQLEYAAEHGERDAEWATAVLTKIAADSSKTIVFSSDSQNAIAFEEDFGTIAGAIESCNDIHNLEILICRAKNRLSEINRVYNNGQ